MKVEATWRGEGRLELLLVGVQPADADRIIETLEASSTSAEERMAVGPVGWAVGFEGSTFCPPVWHHWSGRYMSDCHRWRAERVGPLFRPFLEDEHACRRCEVAA